MNRPPGFRRVQVVDSHRHGFRRQLSSRAGMGTSTHIPSSGPGSFILRLSLNLGFRAETGSHLKIHPEDPWKNFFETALAKTIGICAQRIQGPLGSAKPSLFPCIRGPAARLGSFRAARGLECFDFIVKGNCVTVRWPK